MNVLFLSISSLPHIREHSISLDLIHEFQRQGHSMYVVCALEKKENQDTFLAEEAGCKVLRVKIGNNKKANIIEKGITTMMLPRLYISAIKKTFSDVKFDLILYPTPPITQVKTVQYLKQRNGALCYLLLKDIFPQNAIDLGMMRKYGAKGIIYRYFRNIEKKLYSVSDCIGCMSQANVDYVIQHNPEIDPSKIEICPNSIEVSDKSISQRRRAEIREKYGLPKEKKIYIYGGNLGKPQGIPFLIDCLKSVRHNAEALFLIVGDGTEYAVLENYINTEKPENVMLLKRLPKEDYDTLVAACDVGLIFLDHRFTIPNFPSRLLAYMQAKLPVLAVTDPNTDIGKIIIDGGFGWWCESNNPDAFRSIIQDSQNTDLTMMKENAYYYLEKHYSSKQAYETIIRRTQ